MNKNIKEIIFFANGDPRSASMWSNVPACFVKELELRNIVVHTINLDTHPFVGAVYNLLFRRILKILLKPIGITPVWYFNSRIYNFLGYRKIKKAVTMYPSADYCFFINYLFYNKFNGIPSLLLSDWPQTFDLNRDGHKDSLLYKRVYKQEKDAIEHAKHVISIFKVRAMEMCISYPCAKVSFLGGNVINNLSGEILNEKNILEKKEKSNSILFIGKPDRYLSSAKLLIEVYLEMKKKPSFAKLRLNIIGITSKQLGNVPMGVQCYGFLHKDVESECQLYYNLLKEAKVIVNPTPHWAAYSAMIEAMYYYTPVVVSPYDAFVDEFGKDISFGVYNGNFSTVTVSTNIMALLKSSNYFQMCIEAHRVVKDYTWSVYVDKVLNLLKLSELDEI